MSTDSFGALGVSADITKGLDTKGIKKPTAVQKNALPILVEDNDCRVTTPNGDEASAIVAIAALRKIDANTKKPQALVLTKNQDTTAATLKFIVDVAASLKIDCLSVTMSVDVKKEKEALAKGPQVIVGTPARVATSINIGNLDAGDIKVLVVEQASDTLDVESALGQTYNIISKANERKQIIVITPTVSANVKKVCSRELASRYDVDKDGADYHSMYDGEPGDEGFITLPS